ncbi:MAG: hypothetical protein ACRDS1_08400 [Pseudonocardiaceae bacterium]
MTSSAPTPISGDPQPADAISLDIGDAAELMELLRIVWDEMVDVMETLRPQVKVGNARAMKRISSRSVE